MEIQSEINRAQDLENDGKPQEASEVYRQILNFSPNNKEALHQFGLFHLRHSHPDQAWQLLIKSLEVDSSQFQVWLDLTGLFFQIGDFQSARQAVNNAYRLNPEFAACHYWLGALNVVNGKIDEAMENFETTIRLDPYYLTAYKEILTRRPEPPEAKKIKALESFLKEKNFSTENQALIHGTLAGIYENANNTERYFFHLNRANKLQRSQFGEWRKQIVKNFEGVMAPEMKEFFGTKPIQDEGDFIPIFIVSLPRSGSTLVEQILSSHPKVAGGGEMPFFPNLMDDLLFTKTGSTDPGGFKDLPEASLKKLSEIYLKKVRKLAGPEPYITDKWPWNFVFAGHIKKILPKAKVIHISRDPLDCGYSIYKHFFLNPMPNLCDHEDYAWYRAQYEKVMEFWDGTLPGFIHNISYEKLVENPEKEIRALLEFCGLDWDPVVLDFHKNQRSVGTLSMAQVKEPINRKGIGAAKKYQNHLEELVSSLKKYDLI
ncbi:MAG: sulfotransferase [Sphingomonadales bacterium]